MFRNDTNVSKGYRLFVRFAFRFQSSIKSLNFNDMDRVAEDLLPVNFTKVVPSSICADENRL